MKKIIIEKKYDKDYRKTMYKVVKLINSDRLHLLNMRYDEPSMLRYIKALPATYSYEIKNKMGV
jgi:hypothetical protein